MGNYNRSGTGHIMDMCGEWLFCMGKLGDI
jgi:hypothetical protein